MTCVTFSRLFCVLASRGVCWFSQICFSFAWACQEVPASRRLQASKRGKKPQYQGFLFCSSTGKPLRENACLFLNAGAPFHLDLMEGKPKNQPLEGDHYSGQPRALAPCLATGGNCCGLELLLAFTNPKPLPLLFTGYTATINWAVPGSVKRLTNF